MNEELLKEEYIKLQSIVEDFDARALTIKAWSVTLSAAGVVAAYVETRPVILIIASISSAVFWLVEAMWKNNQFAFYHRIKQIEECFRTGKIDEFPPFQIATSWSSSWKQCGGSKNAFWVMTWPHVALPHVVVSILAVTLYFFFPPCTAVN